MSLHFHSVNSTCTFHSYIPLNTLGPFVTFVPNKPQPTNSLSTGIQGKHNHDAHPFPRVYPYLCTGGERVARPPTRQVKAKWPGLSKNRYFLLYATPCLFHAHCLFLPLGLRNGSRFPRAPDSVPVQAKVHTSQPESNNVRRRES